jgi:hypothetical protein
LLNFGARTFWWLLFLGKFPPQSMFSLRALAWPLSSSVSPPPPTLELLRNPPPLIGQNIASHRFILFLNPRRYPVCSSQERRSS